MRSAGIETITRVLGEGAEEAAARAAAEFAARAAAEGMDDVAYAPFDSPFGRGYVAATRRGVVGVALPGRDEDAFLDDLAAGVSPRVLELPERLEMVRRQLDEYFAGKRRRFEVDLDWSLVSPGFYGRVLRQTVKLPYGSTATYGELAALAGNPRASRAAGTALATNPIPLIVPCHRVLRSGGLVGQYAGGPEMKRFLLELEGALSSGGS